MVHPFGPSCETHFMQSSAWIALLRRMSASLHGNLTIVTRIGQVIAVQDVFRLEEDFAVLRGRMSGSTDAGRVFLLPYDEMHYLAFQKPMKENEIAAIFGTRDPSES